MAPTCLLSLLDDAVFAAVVADVLRLAVSDPVVGKDAVDDGWP
jgi:hypothetical protein